MVRIFNIMRMKKSKNDFFSAFVDLMFGIVILSFSAHTIANDTPKILPNKSVIAAKLGIMQFIIVPIDHQTDKKYHVDTIKLLCPEKDTCFLNFFTNSKNTRISFPLNDEILNEPTLIYRRSAKHQNATFQWSCRLNMAVANCF